MAHPNEEIARSAGEALSKGDMESFLALHTDDTVLHFPGRGQMAGDYRSAMPWRPVPNEVCSASNPTPSSTTSNVSRWSPSERRSVTRVAFAYFATFWRASRQEK